MNHVQCVLTKENKTTVSWIPEKFAVVGKTIKLKDDNKWEDGWIVQSTGYKLDSSYVIKHSRDYKKTRIASDI